MVFDIISLISITLTELTVEVWKIGAKVLKEIKRGRLTPLLAKLMWKKKSNSNY